MAFRAFVIPARDDGTSAEEVNAFLRGHRVLTVDQRWVEHGERSYWAFCVDYLETPRGGAGPKGQTEHRGKVDYRELLSPEHFALYAKLRTLRGEISKAEAVPVYVVFTNEQLAAMVQGKARSKADLGRIDGVGDARIQKYGERFVECLRQHGSLNHEEGRESAGPDPGTGQPASGVLEGGPGQAGTT